MLFSYLPNLNFNATRRATPGLDLIARKVEPILVVLALLYFSEIVLPVPFVQVINLASYGVLLLLLFLMGRWNRFAYVITRDPALLLLLGIAVISVLWSAAPAYTLDETKALVRTSLLGMYLAARYPPRAQMNLFAWTIALAAGFSIITAVLLPAYGTHLSGEHAGLWRGIYAHKQYLGRMMTVGFMPLLLMAINPGQKYRSLAAIGAVLAVCLVLLSGSKTSLVLLITSVLLLPLYKVLTQRFKLRTFLLSTVCLLGGVLLVLVVSHLETIVVDILGKSLELNSRTEIWNLALPKGWERPWLGYGYSGFWTSDESAFIFRLTWAGDDFTSSGQRFHAHNGFIDVFLQVGLIGLFLCLLSFFRAMGRSITLATSSTENPESFWMFSFLVITLLFNVTETRTFIATNTFWILTVSISLTTALRCLALKRQGTADDNTMQLTKS